jgi:DNA-binding NtrC family response regulator
MTGRELAERVTARRPGVKVLLMSGYAAGPETAIPAGARYIEKPFAAPALAQALRHALDETD